MTGAGAAALTAAAVFMAPAAVAAPADEVREAVEAVQEQAERAVAEAEQALEDARQEAEQAAGNGSARAQREAEQAVAEAEEALQDAQQEAGTVDDRAQREAEQAVSEAEQALEDAQREAEQAAENGSARAQQQAEQAVTEAEQALRDVRQEARQALDEARQAADEAQRQAEDALGNLPTIKFGDWLPDHLQRDLQELQDTPASQRTQELEDIVQDALDGDYGARAENLSERFGGMLASLPPTLRQDIRDVLGQEPEEARADVRRIMEDAVDGEYGPEVEKWAHWLRETARSWDLAGAIQGTGDTTQGGND
ncbi:hypothetical protein [Blastococcus sp. SYSU DS0539]